MLRDRLWGTFAVSVLSVYAQINVNIIQDDTPLQLHFSLDKSGDYAQ